MKLRWLWLALAAGPLSGAPMLVYIGDRSIERQANRVRRVRRQGRVGIGHVKRSNGRDVAHEADALPV